MKRAFGFTNYARIILFHRFFEEILVLVLQIPIGASFMKEKLIMKNN